MLHQVTHRVPAVVALPAEIDLTSAERAYGELHAAFAGGAAAVIADFSATTFCDCSSLRRLLAVQHRAACRGARLVLVIPHGSPVSRLAELVSLDSRLPVYPSLREAAAQLPETRGDRPPAAGRQEVVRMADILDVIRASRLEIVRCQSRFSELAGQRGGPESRQAQAAMWDMLAALISLHLSAEDEICLPAAWPGPEGPARARAMLDDHEDIRELIREARLQPPGSPLWRQLTAAALEALAGEFGREEHGLLAILGRADPTLRQRLARQWRSFAEAQQSDSRPAEDEAAGQIA